MNRRGLFKMAAGASGILITKAAGAESVCSLITPTAPQTEGPFYPQDWKEYEADADMTKIGENGEYAKGQVVILQGQVNDLNCKPVVGAEVDVWQANIFGQYFHERDAEFEDLKDKNFQYRCRVLTDKDGKFSVKTIKPAAYPASETWIRPPHIHFKVKAEGFNELTTQMYFGNDPLNPRDRILNNMTEAQRNGVIVDFAENDQKVLEGLFSMVLD